MSINPLQALNIATIPHDEKDITSVLNQVQYAEATCQDIYDKLTQRTKNLADEILEVEFSWRVRVGGMRGFRELLLPVFHPVYGVP